MPYTLAHTIVALPAVGRRRVSAAGMASGAVAPDLPLFLSGGRGYDLTHSAVGAVTVDVLLGTLCLVAWWALVRPGLLAVLPSALRGRTRPLRIPTAAAIAVGLVLGSVSHVAWDAFTHRGRLGSELLPVLAGHLGPLSGTSWLQYLSTAFGLGALIAAAVVAVRRTRVDPSRTTPPLARGTSVARVAVLGVALVLVALALDPLVAAGTPEPRSLAFAGATGAPLGIALGLAAVGAVVRSREGSDGRPAAPPDDTPGCFEQVADRPPRT